MKKIYFTIIPVALFLLAVLPGGFSRAAEPAFTFTYADQKFPVSSDELKQWQGQQVLSSSKILEPVPSGFKNSLLVFVGQPAKTNSNFKIYNYHLGAIYNFVQNFYI